jgi:hypothetical protein
METLADAYLRAVAYVRDTPGGYGAALVLLERTLAEWHTVFSRPNMLKLFAAFDDALAEANARYAAAPPDSRDAERALGLALDAIGEVNRQWWQSDAATPHLEHPPSFVPGPYDPERDRAIATWAADAIARASYPRVTVPPLAPELTPEVCATWLEVFARGLATARRPTVAMPGPILGGLLGFRAQGIVPSATRSPIAATRVAQRLGAELARDKTFRTFAAGDLEHWRLTSTRAQLAFDLPFVEGASPKVTRERGATGARTVLTGPLLRAYIATWALMGAWTLENGGNNPFGIFDLDPRRVLGELYGLRSKTTTVGGKSYDRPPTTAAQQLKKELARLQVCLLEGIGPVTASPPEALVTRYRHEDGQAVYRHAPLAMIALGQHYVQVPREVLRLDAHDTPMGLGLARVLCHEARAILRGPGHWRGTLGKLARSIGEPVEEEARRDGAPRAFAQLAERLQRVTRDGALGALRVEGEGPKALVTLTPSEALGTIYSTIAERPDRPRPSPTPAPSKPRRRVRRAP